MADPNSLWAWLQSFGGGSPAAPVQLPGATPAQPAGTVQTTDRFGNPLPQAGGISAASFNPFNLIFPPAAAAEASSSSAPPPPPPPDDGGHGDRPPDVLSPEEIFRRTNGGGPAPAPAPVGPLAMPSRPVTPTPASAYPMGPPRRPVTPTPATAYPATQRRTPGAPDLGYYRATTGNAQGPATWTPYASPNDPRIYRG